MRVLNILQRAGLNSEPKNKIMTHILPKPRPRKKELTFEQAMVELDKGEFIKLPEWIGHWFGDDRENIKVFTMHGEVLETPYLDDYKNRTDWETTDGLRDFAGALKAIFAGKLLRRLNWQSQYIGLQLGSSIVVTEVRSGIALHRTKEGNCPESVTILPHIDMRTEKGEILVGWVPSQEEMAAEDWEIIEPEQI